jgi:hypothetical protein
MARELPQNQIRPAAQPLSSFIQPARRDTAAPAGPLQIPGVSQISVIQQGTGGNVQGANQFAELAQALAPFNQQLTQLVGTGMQMYAKAEYQKGVNEALRAQVLANQQTLQSGAEYTAENRKLAQADPIGAMMMDSVNPYRRAGRENKLSELAGLEAKSTLIAGYRNTPGLHLLEPGDSRLTQVKAQALQELAQKYGLNQSSRGFVENVLPRVNQGYDRVTELHWQDRQNYLKDTVHRTAAAELEGIYSTSVQDGQIEVYGPDGRPMLVTSLEGGAWDRARIGLMGATLDRIANEMGLPGETMATKRKAIERVLSLAEASGNDELKRLVLSIPVGPPDASGYRAPASTFFQTEALDARIKYGEVRYRDQQRAEETLGRSYQDELVNSTYGIPDGPERLTAIETLRQDERFQGLPLTKKLELEQATSTTIDSVVSRGRSAESVGSLLQDMDGRYGAAWNPAQADAEFEATLAGAPEDKKDELRRQYAAIRRRNNERESSPTAPQVNAVIDRTIKANLEANYPESVTQAAVRENDIQAFMGWNNANVAESTRRQYSAYQTHVRNRISEREGELGRPLTAPEATQVATQAIQEYGRNSPEARNYLLPGVGQQPGVQGIPVQPAPGPAGASGQPQRQLPAGTREFTKPIYPAGQLDNIPDRRGRAQNWRNEPVLDAQSVVQEANRILSGGQPSAALRRFAREAGITPGELLNRHIDFFPGSIEVPAADRQRLLQMGQQARGLENSALHAASASPGPVARASGWVMDVLMGTRPAAAAPSGAAQLRSAVGVANSGGGGGGTVPRGSVPGGTLPVGQITNLARSAGFSGEEAVIMAAIAMAESSGRSSAHNPDASTGDNSYGLWQINMLGRMGPERRRQFGISRNEDLFDPATNAMAARRVFLSQGFGAWSVYRSNAYRQYLPAARRALSGR